MCAACAREADMVAIFILLVPGLAGLSLALYILIVLPSEETSPLDYVLAFHLLVMSAVYLTGAVLAATLRSYALRVIARLPAPSAESDFAPAPPRPARPSAPEERPRDLVAEVLTEHGLTEPAEPPREPHEGRASP